MVQTKFIEIHYLTPHTGVLLNRGSDGRAKQLTLGDEVRSRISSQSLKRRWADADGRYSIYDILQVKRDVRSRKIIDDLVMPSMKDETQATDEVLEAVQTQMNIGIYGSENADDEHNRQSLLLGLPEVEFLRERAEQVCNEFSNDPEAARDAVKEMFRTERANFAAMLRNNGLNKGIRASLFGRMMTSFPEANTDAAIHVAQAFTVHPEELEHDFFSAVDDLNRLKGTPGAAYTGVSQLISGLFYDYVVVDVPGLVQNLEAIPRKMWMDADRNIAGEIVHNLIMTITREPTGAKKGATAPYSRASLVLLQAGDDQPCSLAEAFRKPVYSGQMEDTLNALREHMEKMDRMYPPEGVRRYASREPVNLPAAQEMQSVNELADWARKIVQEGAA